MKKAFLSILLAVIAFPVFVGMVGVTDVHADEINSGRLDTEEMSDEGSLMVALELFGEHSRDPNGQCTGVNCFDKNMPNSSTKIRQQVKKRKEEEKNSDGEGVIERCGNSGGANALGWIICPALEWAGDQAEGVYNKLVKPSLKIEPRLFVAKVGSNKSNATNGTEAAWGTFRDMANVLFVIMFLIVILSQITGVGIDNYGIKKILPKLIIAAVLINLSYIICLFFIDISNILGNGFQALFDGLGNNLKPTVTIDGAYDASGENPITNTKVIATGGSLAAIGIVGVFIGMTGGVWGIPGIVLSILVGLIGVAIAFFFLLVLLSAREAAVVVLVVMSPLAIVCYMLPNTKKLFDRWVSIFKAMLLLYPICGILVGGGNYVSSLLLSVNQGSFLTAIVAMLAGIAPIFFIPTLTKQAFAAMGNLGAKISSFGAGMSKKAQGATANSSLYRAAQDKASKYKNRKIKAMDDKFIGKTGRYAKFRRGMRGGIGNIVATRAMTKKADEDEVANWEALINDMTRNGDDKEALYTYFDNSIGKDGKPTNKAAAVAAARIAGRRKDTAQEFASKFAGDVGSYNDEIARAVSKEISTGSNSAIFRSSSPFEYAYASDLHSGNTSNKDYNNWLREKDEKGVSNATKALDNFVTNNSELVGMKGKELDNLADLMDSNINPDAISDATTARIRNLATQTIENRDKPGSSWDSTKAKQFARLSGKYTYDEKTDTLIPITSGGITGGGAGGSVAGNGSTFNVPHGRENVPVNDSQGNFVSE